MISITLPKLTAYQREVWEWLGNDITDGKAAVIVAPRQTGKSIFCLIKCLQVALSNKGTTCLVIEPTISNARAMFKTICKLVLNYRLVKFLNGTTLELELINGSQIIFRSTEQQNRGYTANFLILDEAAYLENDAIYTILPVTNAHNAQMIIVSSPFAKDGYFYDMYIKGLEGENKNIKTFDWSKHPDIRQFLTQEKMDFYKQTMSRIKYMTEIEGQFLEQEGLLFQNIANCTRDAVSNDNMLFIGIDFAAAGNDYTAISAINGKGEQIYINQFNNISTLSTQEWIARELRLLDKKYTIRKILAESNSIGKVYIDSLTEKTKFNITPFIQTNSTKQNLVTSLQLALENEEISIINNPIQINELLHYEAQVNPKTKTVSYNGKLAHDDIVIALMLSWWAYKQSYGDFRLIIT